MVNQKSYNMEKLFLFFTISILISACSKNEPRIVYDQNDKVDNSKDLGDSGTEGSKKLFADIPFSFDSLKYLYFPIGETNESFKMNVRSFASSYSKTAKSYSLGYVSDRDVSCNLNNLLIRPKNIATFKLLTKSDLRIKSLNYLYRIDTIFGIDRFIYRIIDSDSNKDTYLNDDDLVGLYTSKTNGDDLKRVSPKNQQLIDWETIDLQGLLYFRTMEDIDRNGAFDDKDRINLYEYNLIKGDSIKLIFNDKIYQEMK